MTMARSAAVFLDRDGVINAKTWEMDLAASYMIGDRCRDIDAGGAAGCRTVLVGDGYAERAAQGFDLKADSLLEATRLILNLEPTAAMAAIRSRIHLRGACP